MSLRFFGIYWHLPLVLLGLGELLILLGALLLAGVATDTRLPAPFLAIFVVCCMLVMGGFGLFSRRLRARTSGIVLRLIGGIGLGAILAKGIASAIDLERVPVRTVGLACFMAFLLATLLRALVSRRVGENIFQRNVLIFGAGTRAQSISGLRRRSDLRGFKMVGFVRPDDEEPTIPSGRLLDVPENLLATCRELEVDEIVVAMDDRRRNFPVAELLECRLAGIDVVELITFLERETGKVRLDVLHPSWLIFGEGFRQDSWREGTRRVFDVLASLFLILISWPVMLLTALCIKFEDGLRAPVFYRQTRVGLMGKNFEIFKFRSMRIDAESDGRARWAQKDDNRVTRVGRIIRLARIDELPQIFNVFVGDMSIVGPRPERPHFVSQLSERIPYFRERHYVRPGITGWAQLCYAYGASEQDAAEKLQYDLYYVKNHGLLFDLVILIQTLEVIIFGKGAR